MGSSGTLVQRRQGWNKNTLLRDERLFPGGSTVHPQDETEFQLVNPEDEERRLQELPSSQCLLKRSFMENS